MNSKKGSRDSNNAIYFWKFLYSFIIVYFHFFQQTKAHFLSGRYGVDFYLLVAGLFLFSKYEKQMCNDGRALEKPYMFLIRRFARFFPWALAGFIFAAIVCRGFINPVPSFGKLLDYFSSDIWEILLIKMNGLNNNKALLNGPAWTLSSMLIAQFFIWSCLYCYKEKFTNLIMPLTIIVGLGIWRFIDQAAVKNWIGFTTFGTFRAWIVICLGYYSLKCSQKLLRTRFNILGKALLTILELLCHIFAIWVIMNRDSRNYQWCCILAFMIATSIELSGNSLMNDFLNRSSFVTFLGKLSMCIYLAHGTVLKLWCYFYPEPDVLYSHVLSFTAAVIIVSVLMYYAVTYGIKLYRILSKKIVILLTDEEALTQ